MTAENLVIFCRSVYLSLQYVMLGAAVFILCALALVAGYFLYGRLVEKVYGPDKNFVMPCISSPDGVDYVPLPTWKIFLIQLLNIAGLGPVVGAVSGCLFGPSVLFWIVLGCIFAGAVHDFTAAFMSADLRGRNLPDVMGLVMGRSARVFMSIMCVFLLLMVGVVFTLLPAGMLHGLMPDAASLTLWGAAILVYYFLATMLPIQSIIGRIYPVFGALFLFMAVGLVVGMCFSNHEFLPNLEIWRNHHPQNLGIWPMVFVTIACGAISGFHATQSPMMVRCLRDVQHMRRVFYGAMVVEGLVALVWAVVGLSLRECLFNVNGEELSFAALTLKTPSLAINEACRLLMGDVCAFVAVLGVVVLAITSGDTAMRSCRLMLADLLNIPQKSVVSRLALAIPLFAVVFGISQVDFSVIWRYFGWANQTLACLTLWCVSLYLRNRRRCYWISLLPALLMTVVCTCYFLYSPDCGMCIDIMYATLAGIALAVIFLLLFLYRGAAKPSVRGELTE